MPQIQSVVVVPPGNTKNKTTRLEGERLEVTLAATPVQEKKIEGCRPETCPICKVKVPNLRRHAYDGYLSSHEKGPWSVWASRHCPICKREGTWPTQASNTE